MVDPFISRDRRVGNVLTSAKPMKLEPRIRELDELPRRKIGAIGPKSITYDHVHIGWSS